MNKIEYFLILIIYIFFFSCSNENKSSNLSKKQELLNNEELYFVLDELFRFDLYDTDLLETETMRLHKREVDIEIKGDLPPPPPYKEFDKDYFSRLVERKILTNEEANYMFKNIDTIKILTLDSSRINSIKTIDSKELSGYFKKLGTDSAYNYLYKVKKVWEFATISTPIFSEKRDKLILIVHTSCGGTCGEGYVYIFAKKNKKWKIITKYTIFVS